MPTVPKYQLQAGASETFDAPRTVPFQAQGPEQAQQLGRGLQRFGVQIDAMADELQSDIDSAKTKRFALLASKARYDAVLAHKQRLGSTAIDEHAKALENFEKQLHNLGEAPDNEVQRAALEQVLAIEGQRGKLEITDWTAEQTHVSNVANTDATILMRKMGAQQAAASGDFQTAQEERFLMDEQVYEKAQLLGWGKEQTEAQLKVEAAKMHVEVLQGLADKPAYAQQWLDRYAEEVPADVRVEANERIDRLRKIDKTEKDNAQAWVYANQLARTKKPIAQQQEAIDMSVRTGRVSGDVAMKTWALVNQFADQKWQDLQRERALIGQQLEQAFAKDPGLSVDGLPAETLDSIDRAGMRAKAFEIHGDVRRHRIADMIANDENDVNSLVVQRDMRSIRDIQLIIPILDSKKSTIEATDKSVAGIKKAQRIQKAIDDLEEQMLVLASLPRSFVTAADAAPSQSVGSQPAPQPIDLPTIIKQVGSQLYPGSGR